MNWETARETYKNSWVLFEAIDAHSNDGKRVVENLSVLDSFEDSKDALQVYKDIHKREPQRELYVVHTQKEVLEIIERKWLGIRR